jgi:hypothetical protein
MNRMSDSQRHPLYVTALPAQKRSRLLRDCGLVPAQPSRRGDLVVVVAMKGARRDRRLWFLLHFAGPFGMLRSSSC